MTRFLPFVLTLAGCSEYNVGNGADVEQGGIPDITVDPLQLDFGATGTTGASTRSVRVSNLGTAPLDVSELVIDDGSPFSLAEPSVPFEVEPGDAAILEIVWTPTDEMDLGALRIRSDDPDTPEFVVPLSGQRLFPVLTIEPDPLLFETLPVGCTVTAPVDLRNTGLGTLILDDVVLTGTGFSLATDAAFPAEVAPGSAQSVDVTFTPLVGASALGATLAAHSNDRRGLVTSAVTGASTAPVLHVDLFEQGDGNRIDLLFFVDQSASMDDDAQNLSDNFGLFLDNLLAGGIDYHVVVITDDDGCHNESIITPLTVDPEGIFATAIVGPSGLYTEAGLIVTSNALAATDVGECNEGFLRASVPALMVMVSDEVEQSPLTWDVYVAAMQGVVPDIVVNAVVGQSNAGCAKNGIGYHEAAAATGGVDLDLCTADWGNYVLDILGTAELNSSFSLTVLPDPATLVVEVGGAPATGWTWDPALNDVVFDEANVPPPGAEIEVRYDEAAVCP